jgi:hypothetical protein
MERMPRIVGTRRLDQYESVIKGSLFRRILLLLIRSWEQGRKCFRNQFVLQGPVETVRVGERLALFDFCQIRSASGVLPQRHHSNRDILPIDYVLTSAIERSAAATKAAPLRT